MSADEKIAPQIALNRFLSVIRQRAEVDATFRDDLIQALGVSVSYEGEDDLTNVAPHIIAAKKDELQFRAIYGRLSAAKLRAIFKRSELATTADVARKSADDLIDMLWKRANSRARERGLID
ncbi:hypothetical protein [Vitreimonas sp.]|uniref:hypothetical protein n=1 Tax=Vitreimonas sp. TaxID=3069702 RepID=UPI002ED97DB8